MRTEDLETTKILYNLNIKNLALERRTNSIKDYLDKMNSLRVKIIKKSVNKESFMKNEEEIKEDLLLVGTMFFCYFIHIKEMAKQFGDTFEENQNPFIVKSTIFPGSHDYCVALARNFDYELYLSFYKLFLDEVNILICSEGTILPRFFHVITVFKSNKYQINEYVLLTKKDLTYKNFTQLELPKYYILCEELASKERYYELFSKYIKNDLEVVWNRFVNGEYKLYEFMLQEKSCFCNLEPIPLIDINSEGE